MARLAWPVERLEAKALDVRRDIITMLANAGSGHSGGSLSSADFLTALLFHEVDIRPEEPKWPDRDFWHVSNAHISPVIYSVMAERGYFPLADLLGFRQIHGHLQGHPSAQDTPGLETSAGSLGQGLSVTVGAALASKMDGHRRRCYCEMGDGEQQEGSIWEAVMSAAHFSLDNLCAIIDYNLKQIDGDLDVVMRVSPLAEKYRAFGWHVVEVDGHDMRAIVRAFAEARMTKGRPTVILARTIMGRGVKFMEDDCTWHGRPPTVRQAEEALGEWGTSYEEWKQRLAAGVREEVSA